jgi:hypothetical protein
MKRTTVFRIWAALSGLALVWGALLPWHGDIQRIKLLLGLEIFSTDELFRFAYTTILAGIVGFVASVFLAKAKLWRSVGILAMGVCVVIGLYNYWTFRHESILSGLIMTIAASLSGLAAFVLYPRARTAEAPPAQQS